MPATTPPKGRPTAGRRDRNVATRRSRSRGTTKRFIWGVLALTLVVAILVVGSGTGGNGNVGTSGGHSNFLIPALFMLRARNVLPGPPARS